MPTFDNTPNAVVRMLVPGKPEYAFGSLPLGPPCRMMITGNSVSGNVVTLNVRVVEGNIPAIGDLIFTYATANSAGALNQTTGIPIASVNITASTGIGTVTFAKTVGNQGQTNDVGYALTQIAEVGELITAGQVTKSQAFAIQNRPQSGYGITWSYTFPSAPASVSLQLEGAVSNNDAEYTIIGSSQSTTSGYNEIPATLPELFNFVRVKINSLTGGTNPSCVAKILSA